MSSVVQPAEVPEQDDIDRIAAALPVEVRADYYREMRHCRSLPENDEMLRILRAMQFLTLLIHQAPTRLAEEREKLDQALTGCVAALQQVRSRLNRLPNEIAGGISPEAIASKINESLHQQFMQSGIPQTGEALAALAAQLKSAVAGFQQSSTKISNAHHSAAADADRAVRNIDSAISKVADTARRAAAEMTNTYIHEYRWSVIVLVGAALLVGCLFGVAFENWNQSPVVTQTNVTQPAAPAKTRR